MTISLVEAQNRLDRIQVKVGAWSRKNFGEQISKASGVTLGSLNPLLGICEEYMEWQTAEDSDSSEDAIADILIYLCDWASRENILLSTYIVSFAGPYIKIEEGLRKLIHATLKRHQGIRGFDALDKYRDEIGKGIANIFCAFNYVTTGPDAWLSTLERTWEKVEKRDWNKNPSNAAQVAEAQSGPSQDAIEDAYLGGPH